MLHLQPRAQLLSAFRTDSSLQRLLLYSTTATPAAQFVVEDYLVASCGLTAAQALKASKYILHLKSPENADAVRAFLAGIGVSKAAAAAAIARDPRLLTFSVDRTLAPRTAQLLDIGLSPPDISRLITIVPRIFNRPAEISRLASYLSFLGSYDAVHAALRSNLYLLGQSLEDVVKPNMELLLRCGLTRSDVTRLLTRNGTLLAMAPERVKEMVARAEKLGVRRNSGMFKSALEVVTHFSPQIISAKIYFLRRALGCSGVELAWCKSPRTLTLSESNIGRTVEFLKVEVGLEPSYIVQRPVLIQCSLQRRLIPRNYVIKVLKAKGLVKQDIDFFNVICASEKRFVERFLDPHKESVPGLAGTYTAACAGKLPPEIKL